MFSDRPGFGGGRYVKSVATQQAAASGPATAARRNAAGPCIAAGSDVLTPEEFNHLAIRPCDEGHLSTHHLRGGRRRTRATAPAESARE